MIEFIAGRLEKVLPRGVVIEVAGVGWLVQVPDPLKFTTGEVQNLQIAWVWNAEKGPTLYGFKSELERTVFNTLIECPKIGPQISLQILSQASAQKILQILAMADEHALGSFTGIGPKKAKTMVGELQDKAVKLLAGIGSELESGEQNTSLVMDEVCGALKAMGYSAVEISSAVARVNASNRATEKDFASLMRLVLAQLLKQKTL